MCDDLCDYGCDNKATVVFKNGKKCCSENYRSCPYMATSIGKTRIGKKHTDETKAKIGTKSRERLAVYNHRKGTTLTPEQKLAISQRNTGRSSWSKGLTAKDHPGLQSALTKRLETRRFVHPGESNGMYERTHTQEVKQAARDRNIITGKWKGSNNPWFGKSRSGNLSPRYVPDELRPRWLSYRLTVRRLTEQCYNNNIDIINPSRLKRGIRSYHLDHIIPIWYGFMSDISPYILADIDNLRLLYWTDNLARSKQQLTEDEHDLLIKIVQKLQGEQNDR